ncbi:hypothetical protein [Sporosarcina sp. OR05]|uniref:hypothetical protein n=1 Tax=Sporosarcina sp. OR05 TaxID=2969819 RepID=UPI00352B209E
MNVAELLEVRNVLAVEHRNFYLKTINNLNETYKDELNNDLGYNFFVACKDDLLGQFVRRFFNTSDYYLTVDQLWQRISTFSYEDDYNPLLTDEGYKKSVMNYNDPSRNKQWKSTTTKWIDEINEKHTKLVYDEKRSGNEPMYGEDGKKYYDRTEYKRTQINPDSDFMEDELTGATVRKDSLQGDHIIPRKGATANERYMKDSFNENKEKFYDSRSNIQYINERANNVKSNEVDVAAVVKKWEETKTAESRQILEETGYLNKDGTVNKDVKKQLEKTITAAENKESQFKLKHVDYKQVGQDSAKQVAGALSKMVVGQLIYYALPPIVYETRRIIKAGVNTLDQFLESFELAIKRTINYVAANMKNMFKNISNSAIKKFVKTFFDILLSLVKHTVRRLLMIVKDLALAVIDSIRILFSKEATKAEKADSIVKLLVLTISNTVVIIGLELLEKSLGLPSFAMEGIELLAVILVSNLVTLLLHKADLFDVQYGLKTENLKRLIDEHHISYTMHADELIEAANNKSEVILSALKNDITEIQKTLSTKDVYKDDLFTELNNINDIFNMDIDFDREWEDFVAKGI